MNHHSTMKLPTAKSLRFILSLAVLALAFTSPAQAQSRIYYTDDYHDASMAVNGTDKRVDTRGEPSYYLHGGQRWFLQFRAVAGTYPDGRTRYEVFAVSQDQTSIVQLSDNPNFAPNFVRWLKDDGAVSYSGVHFHSADTPGTITAAKKGGDSHIMRLALSDTGGVLAPAGLPTVVATAGVTVVSGPYLQSDIQSYDWAPSGAELVIEDAPGYNAGFSVFLIRRVNLITGVSSAVIYGGIGPVYAPNGLEIAFVRVGYQITPGIYAIHPDGFGLRIIVKDSQTTASYKPSWSPDGASVAFNRQTTTQKGSTYNYTWDIFTCPSAGGSGRNIKNLTGDVDYGAFLTGWR